MMEHERWNRVFSATCVGVLWQLRLDQRNLARLEVFEAEADQGVAPVVVMLAVPKTDRKRYVTKRGLVKYGYTDECQACTQLASGRDDAQRQVERVSGLFVHSLKSRGQEPENIWTLVNRRSWKINNQFSNQFVVLCLFR